MILNGEQNWIVMRVFITKSADGLQSLFKIYLFVKKFVLESMGDDRSVSVIMYIQLNAFNPKIKVFQIAINFAVTSQLISRKIGIMRTVAIVVTQGQILIK